MKNQFRPAPTFSFSPRARLLGVGLSALVLGVGFGACSDEPKHVPAKAEPAPAASAEKSAQPAATPAAQKETPTVAASGASGAAERPPQDPSLFRGGKRYEGGIDKLQTNYDLSKANIGAETQQAGAQHAEDDGHDHGTPQADGASLLPGAQAENYKARLELAEGAPQVKDLGKLRQGEAAGFDFTFRSAGEEPLIISGVKPSCGCTKAEVELLADDGTHKPYTKGDPIAVGTKFVLSTEINTDGRQGAFTSQVAIYANDSRGAFNVRLTADVEPVLSILPSSTVFFGRITTKDRVEQSVTVTTTRGEPFLLSLAQDTVQEPVSLTFVAKDPDAEGRSSQWEIKAVLGPNTEQGMRHYPINIKSDLQVANPKYPSQDGSPQYHTFILNLQAQVLGMVSAEPPFLTFGMVKPGESVERTLRLESHDEFKLSGDMPVVIEGLQGQELAWADRFKVTVTPIEEGKAADVKVLLTGLPEDVNGSISGQFRVKVGHPFMDEVPIRFSAVCRPGLPPVDPTGGQQK